MSDASQPVHGAMTAERPAKATVRGWWMEIAAQRIAEARASGRPLYLTLPGGGHDIRALLETGVIARNESGGIADSDAGLVIAIERDLMAGTAIRQAFPNIVVHPVQVSDFLGGDGPTSYPEKRRSLHARAAMVNLDLNGAYTVDAHGGNAELKWVTKFAHLHDKRGEAPACAWTLCLTLNASRLQGDHDRIDDQVAFLLEQANYSVALDGLIEQLAPWIKDDNYLLHEEHDSGRIQRVLMMLVPAKIGQALPSSGWGVTCLRAGLYGHDSEGAAPMVTFVISIEPSPSRAARPQEAATDTHRSLSTCAVEVRADGSTAPLMTSVPSDRMAV